MAAALAAQPAATHGLATFQLRPRGLSGLALFEHMVEFRKRHSPQDEPCPSLDVAMTADQKVIIAPTMADLVVGQILKDAGGDGATKKLAQRKLNNAGAITNHCGLQNHPSRIKKLLSALELTASLAEISALTRANKAKDKCKADTAMMDLAPIALFTLIGKLAGIVAKLKKNELCAIAFRFFGTMLKVSNPKPVLVTVVEGLIAAQPGVLASAGAAAAARTAMSRTRTSRCI